MGGMALVVLGLFVLVWIISAVVKASQDTGPKRPQASRPRPRDPEPRVERTSNTDIDRFMAEIDRLRRKGEGAPAGGRPAEQSRPAPKPIIDRPARLEPRPKPAEPPRRERERDREGDRERRQRQSSRPAPPPPPPVRTDPVPILRPVAPEPPSTSASAPIKPATTAKTRATAVAGAASAAHSPVVQVLQTVLRDRNGRAAALILAEVFGEPRGRRAIQVRKG